MTDSVNKSDFQDSVDALLSLAKPNLTTVSQNQQPLVNSSEGHDGDCETSSDSHHLPSGSRKRKSDKPKRICLPASERPTVPLVEPAKKKVSYNV